MDVVSRAEGVTAHIVDPAKRARVRANLTSFLSALDAIPNDDDVLPEPADQQWRDDGTDGVPLTSLGELEARESRRLGDLRSLHQNLRDTEGEDSDVATVAAAPTVKKKKGDAPPLIAAVKAGDYDLVVDLVTAGARLDETDRMGMSALDCAQTRADSDRPDTIRIVAFLESR